MAQLPMPRKLVAVILLLALSVTLDLYSISQGADGTHVYVGAGFRTALIAGLVMGREWARVLAMVVAVLSLVLGGFTLLALLAAGSAMMMIPSLAVVAFASVGLALGIGGFILWTMKQPDVQDWLMSRSLHE